MLTYGLNAGFSVFDPQGATASVVDPYGVLYDRPNSRGFFRSINSINWRPPPFKAPPSISTFDPPSNQPMFERKGTTTY